VGLRDYLEILWRRRLVVLLVALGVAALAAAPALLQSPGYRSTTTLFFAPRDPAQGAALAGQRLSSYVALVGGPRLAQGVAQQLALPQDPAALEDLAGRLAATAQPESLLVTVSATGGSPAEAQRLARTAAQQLVQLAASLEPPATGTQASPVWLTVAEPADPGVPLARATLIQDLVLGTVLGLAAGAALGLLVEALDPRVVDARGLRRLVPGAVLTLTVPRPPRRGEGPRQETPPPSGAVRALRTTLLGQALRADAHGSRVVVVTGAGVGGGTRTVAHWVATALSRAGRKVVLLRADDQDAREAGVLPGLAEALSGQVPLDELPLRTLEGGPWLLHAGQDLADPGELLAAPGMTEAVQQLGQRFDHVVVEAPPVLPYVETALLAAACADQVVLVVRPGWSRRRQVRAAVDVLAQQEAPVTLSVLTRFLRGSAPAPAVEALPPLEAQLGAVAAGAVPVVAPPAPAPVDGDTATEADPVPHLDPDLGSGLGAPAAEAPEPDAEPEPQPDAEPEPQPDAEPEPQPDAEPEPEPEPEPGAEAGSEAQDAGKPDPDDEPAAGPDEEPREGSGEGSDLDLDAELEAELEADLAADLDPDRDPDGDGRVMSGGRPARGGAA
jgi:Mrp family chromosome partitioning ATPase/capsular polysaccharide biosynthesis protein